MCLKYGYYVESNGIGSKSKAPKKAILCLAHLKGQMNEVFMRPLSF